MARAAELCVQLRVWWIRLRHQWLCKRYTLDQRDLALLDPYVLCGFPLLVECGTSGWFPRRPSAVPMMILALMVMIETRKWEELSPGEGREGTCSSVCAVTPDHKHIYVCGGSNGSGLTPQFHRYSVELDEWEQLEDCPPELGTDICCEYLDGNLLFVGHRTYVWRYNIGSFSEARCDAPHFAEIVHKMRRVEHTKHTKHTLSTH